MGWTSPPSQTNRTITNCCMSGNYNPEGAHYYPNTFQPLSAVSMTTITDYVGDGVNDFHRIYSYPDVPPQQPDLPFNYVQHSTFPHYGDYTNAVTSNSSRQQRNMAEKLRRDKLNQFIQELARLLPTVQNSSKRMDKTSVLRLAATFLRQYQLISTARKHGPKLPQSFLSVDWSDLMLEGMNGVMTCVTSAGKIVFITDNIEQILGHTQSELFGQSLFTITCPEDHPELKRCLAPDDAEEFSAENDLSDCSSDDPVGSESNSCSRSYATASRFNSDGKGTKSSSQLSHRSNSNGSSSTASEFVKQRRSCYLRLRTRSLARSEQPQYELVHLLGSLEVPKKLTAQVQKKSKKDKVDVSNTNSNEIVLVAILKPLKERRVTETSLMEATRDEYITRHTLDGSIIYSDHRISVVSGYLFEEVTGRQAFNFMHKDDVRWVMIALRQMLLRGGRFGSSCYRLKSKTGDFIYLKTHGYLELSSSSDTYTSYICVNTLLSNEDGEKEIESMRKRFSALIENTVDPGSAAIAKDICASEAAVNSVSDNEDPYELEDAIRAMISNIPAPGSSIPNDLNGSMDTQFAKAKLMSKTLPPVSQTGNKTMVEEQSPKSSSAMSPQTLGGGSSVASGSQPSTPIALTPNSPSVSSSCGIQNRPSVLRLARKHVYNDPAANLPNNVNDCDMETTALRSRQQMNSSLYCKRGVLSDQASGQTNERSLYNHIGVVRRLDDSRVGGVIIPRSGLKRELDYHDDDDDDCSENMSVPNKKLVTGSIRSNIPSSRTTYSSKCSQAIKESLSPQQESPAPSNEFTDDLVSCIAAFDPNFSFDIGYEHKSKHVQLQMLDLPSANLKPCHESLESQMQLQGIQMNTLEHEIADVPFTERCGLENDLGKLREEHTKQAELLKTLRSDHRGLQPN